MNIMIIMKHETYSSLHDDHIYDDVVSIIVTVVVVGSAWLYSGVPFSLIEYKTTEWVVSGQASRIFEWDAICNSKLSQSYERET